MCRHPQVQYVHQKYATAAQPACLEQDVLKHLVSVWEEHKWWTRWRSNRTPWLRWETLWTQHLLPECFNICSVICRAAERKPLLKRTHMTSGLVFASRHVGYSGAGSFTCWSFLAIIIHSYVKCDSHTACQHKALHGGIAVKINCCSLIVVLQLYRAWAESQMLFVLELLFVDLSLSLFVLINDKKASLIHSNSLAHKRTVKCTKPFIS